MQSSERIRAIRLSIHGSISLWQTDLPCAVTTVKSFSQESDCIPCAAPTSAQLFFAACSAKIESGKNFFWSTIHLFHCGITILCRSKSWATEITGLAKNTGGITCT